MKSFGIFTLALLIAGCEGKAVVQAAQVLDKDLKQNVASVKIISTFSHSGNTIILHRIEDAEKNVSCYYAVGGGQNNQMQCVKN